MGNRITSIRNGRFVGMIAGMAPSRVRVEYSDPDDPQLVIAAVEVAVGRGGMRSQHLARNVAKRFLHEVLEEMSR